MSEGEDGVGGGEDGVVFLHEFPFGVEEGAVRALAGGQKVHEVLAPRAGLVQTGVGFGSNGEVVVAHGLGPRFVVFGGYAGREVPTFVVSEPAGGGADLGVVRRGACGEEGEEAVGGGGGVTAEVGGARAGMAAGAALVGVGDVWRGVEAAVEGWGIVTKEGGRGAEGWSCGGGVVLEDGEKAEGSFSCF